MCTEYLEGNNLTGPQSLARLGSARLVVFVRVLEKHSWNRNAEETPVVILRTD